MKERPIIFNAESVRAILEGRKSQTRRPMNPQPNFIISDAKIVNGILITRTGEKIKCPFGQVGDRLWVRETWCAFRPCDKGQHNVFASDGKKYSVIFKASHDIGIAEKVFSDGLRWKPSIHMPRWASRITLEITNIRVERVQDIKYSDIVAEGIDGSYPFKAQSEFRRTWNDIYGNFDSNPWVWTIEFKVV